MPKITKRLVESLRPDPSGRDVFVWDAGDGAIKGFGIRMKKSGIASYLVQYRTGEGRTRRLVIGKVEVLAPEEARSEARLRLAEVAKGGDPSAERRKIRGTITVSELCDLYLKMAADWVKASTLAMDGSRIETHVKPLLGRHSVAGLTSEDVVRMQADIAAGKTAKARKDSGRGGVATGGRGVAARTVGMLGTILEFARRQKLISVNPVRGVKRFPDEKSRRFLSEAEIKALSKAMVAAKAESATALGAIRALLLTGCRRNEILGLPRTWLDAPARCIRFGDTKEGAQLRPIGETAAKHLAAMSKYGDSPWVFPSTVGDGHLVGLPRVLGRLCKAAKIEDVTVHTLRHTFAALAAESGYSELTIAGLLGHKVPGVTARYAHVPDAALVAAAGAVSARMVAILDGRMDTAKVVQMPHVTQGHKAAKR
ncbi:MAG: DUF4102 domain-containing protein [Alphaproteobacteria bacterium]|nr:DUF4102 domain-containing protein [Alphaproteobacteria bacterium]